MSSRDYHTGDGAINTEEHLGGDGVNRKAVGLFAKDAYGTGVFELSALSTASGAVLSVTPSTSSSQGFQTVFVGTPTLFAVVNTGAVGNTNALATLLAGPNQIGSVTISNNPNVTVSNLLSLASGQEIKSLATILNWPTSLTSLASGTEVRSLTTILPRTDYIGLVSVSGNVAISNTPAVSQSGNWDIRSLLSVASIYGNVGIIGNPAVDVRSVLSFPTINVVTQDITVNSGMTTLFPGPNQIGSVTVSNFVAPNVGNVTLNPSSAHIGSVSIFGTVQSTPGMTTLFPGPNQIGSVTISNQIDVRSLLSTTTLFAVVNTGAVGNTNALATLLAGPNQIGSVTISGTPTVFLGTPTLFAVVNTDGTTVTANQGGNWDIRSVLSLASVYGKVDLGASSDIRSVLSVASIYGNVGILGTVAVTQSGTWDEVGINDSGNSITVDGSVGLTGLVSLASGTEIRSLATVLNWPTSLTSLASGTEVRSLTTLFPRTDYIGLVSVSGNVGVGTPTVFIGTPTLYAVVNTGAVGNTNSLATLLAGPNQIGSVTISHPINSFATVTPILSSTVVNFLVSAASGKMTQFPTNTVRQGIIQAYSENPANVFIGNSNVTSGISDTRGIELAPGQSAGIEIDQTNKLYLAAATGVSGAVSFFGSG